MTFLIDLNPQVYVRNIAHGYVWDTFSSTFPYILAMDRPVIIMK